MGKPEKPYAANKGIQPDKIVLEWKYDRELGEEEFYQIFMKEHPHGKWKIVTPKPFITRYFIVNGLKAKTSYVFKVCKTNDTTGENGSFSPESDIIITGESPAFEIMKRSKKIEDSIPAVYKLPIQEILQARNEASHTRKFILGISPLFFIKPH